MIALVMKEDNTLLVRQDGDLRGQIAFAGESESGKYVFTPRPDAVFRSGDLVEIARQVAFLNLETINPTQYGFFSPSEDSALRAANETASADTQPRIEACPRCGEPNKHLLRICGDCVQTLVRDSHTYIAGQTALASKTEQSLQEN